MRNRFTGAMVALALAGAAALTVMPTAAQQQGRQGGRDGAGRGRQALGRGAHTTSPGVRLPRTRAMRPVRAISRMR